MSKCVGDLILKSFFRALVLSFFLLVIVAVISLLPYSIAANNVSGNYKNVSIHTYVNITNSKPEVLGVVIYDSTNSALNNITIAAGDFKSVTCNASVRDWNGYNDIVYVNSTLYFVNNKSSDSDDNNTHYTNASCTTNSSTGTYTGIYSCVFNVAYYANNGTWYCNITDRDTSSTIGYGFNTTLFYPVYALNVSDGLDYGNVPVYGYSDNFTANVTNFGNMPINITVQGYGTTIGDGLAMNCSLGGNITVGNEKFSASPADWGSKTVLTSSSQKIIGLTLVKQTLPDTLIMNTTYWQLYIDAVNVPGGNCTGYITFNAIAS